MTFCCFSNKLNLTWTDKILQLKDYRYIYVQCNIKYTECVCTVFYFECNLVYQRVHNILFSVNNILNE